MATLQFNQEVLLDKNIFKYEDRLHTHLNKYAADNSMILCTYFNIDKDKTTTDRGLMDIEEVFGKKSPLRFNRIENFPLLGFGQTNPENTDENVMEDVVVNGECIIMPSTIVPLQNDCFIIKHLKMRALFQVTSVTYDSMKQDGFYKITYRLMETSQEAIDYMEKQTIKRFNCDLNAVGSTLNPIIEEDKFIYKEKVNMMIDDMIDMYRSMFYNQKHNCFLYEYNGYRLFDLCGNMFMAKHSIMNHKNGTSVIMLHQKLVESKEYEYYNRSIYKWIERDAPIDKLNKFKYQLTSSQGYIDSSFYKWGEDDIQVMIPVNPMIKTINSISTFNKDQINLYNNGEIGSSDFDMIISKFINKKLSSYMDIPLSLGNSLFDAIKDKDTFLLTPIIIYIVRRVLEFN